MSEMWEGVVSFEFCLWIQDEENHTYPYDESRLFA